MVWIQGLLCHKAVFDGFIIQSCLAEIEGNSISIELPSNWYNSKWTGFALWASSLGMIQQEYDIRACVIALGDMPQNHCASELFATLISCEVDIGLLYLSCDDWFGTVGNGECNQIVVVFETTSGSGCLVRQCGVSLVYEKDMELMEDFSQANAQCSSSRVIAYEGWDGVHHGFVNSTRSCL